MGLWIDGDVHLILSGLTNENEFFLSANSTLKKHHEGQQNKDGIALHGCSLIDKFTIINYYFLPILQPLFLALFIKTCYFLVWRQYTEKKGEAMQIQLLAPFERAFNRMKTALFKPFDLRKWMVIGFTAFLADLLDGGGQSRGFKNNQQGDWGTILTAPYEAWAWLQSKPEWLMLLVFGVLAAAAILLLLLWLSSRGKFMFLDNVVRQRALVSDPWHHYRQPAASLFRFRVQFALVTLTLAGGTFYHLWRMAYTRWSSSGDLWQLLPSLVLWIIFLLLILLAFGYIKLLLDHFIVPVMYKHDLSCGEAWEKFLPLHWGHAGSFLLYALFILMVIIALVAVVIVGGLFTCCVGFLVLAIPYISSVVLLPFSYWLRSFSLEYLAQFGSDFDLLVQEPGQEQADPQPAPPPAV